MKIIKHSKDKIIVLHNGSKTKGLSADQIVTVKLIEKMIVSGQLAPLKKDQVLCFDKDGRIGVIVKDKA